MSDVSSRYLTVAGIGPMRIQTYTLGLFPIRVVSAPAFSGSVPAVYVPHGAMLVWRASVDGWCLYRRGAYDLREGLTHAATNYGCGFSRILGINGELQKLDRSMLSLDAAREVCMRYSLMDEDEREKAVSRFDDGSSLGLRGEPVLEGKKRARRWLLMAALLSSREGSQIFNVRKGRNPGAALASTVPARELLVLRQRAVERKLAPLMQRYAEVVELEIDLGVRFFSSLAFSLQEVLASPVFHLPIRHNLAERYDSGDFRVDNPARELVEVMRRLKVLATNCQSSLWPDPFLKYSRRIGVELASAVIELDARNFALAHDKIGLSLRSLDFLALSGRISEFKIIFSRKIDDVSAKWRDDAREMAIVLLCAADELEDSGFATPSKLRVTMLLKGVIENINVGDYKIAYSGLREALRLL